MAKLKGTNLPVLLSFLCCAQVALNSASMPVKAQSAPDSNKEKVTTLLKGGIQKHQSGDDAGAEKNFREALRIDSANANAHYNLAALAEAHGERDTALKEYRQVLRYSPKDQSVITAIHELEASTGHQAAVSERTRLQGHAAQDSLLPSADAFATNLSDYPPLAPARGSLGTNTLNGNANRNGLVSSTQFNTLRNQQPTNLALATDQDNGNRNKTGGGSMHAFRVIGMGVLRAGLMYGGRPVDTCACPILRF
jgi:tetratricopeptide (TPR) repeat protein